MTKFKLTHYVNFIIFFFFLVFALLPITLLFTSATTGEAIKFLTSPSMLTASINSINLTIIATVISLMIGFILAYVITRVEIKFKWIYKILFCLPMLIPSISHGMGLVLLFGTNGLITKLLGLSVTIYGPLGIILGSVIYSFPIAFIMFSDILSYEDYLPYQAAKVLGISQFSQFVKLTLPYLTKPLISIFFAVFTMILTDFGVPLIIGGKTLTLPMVMYQEVIGKLNFGTGSIIGIVLLVPAILGFVFDSAIKGFKTERQGTVSFSQVKGKLVKHLSYFLCNGMTLCVGLPILCFCIVGFVKKYPSDMQIGLFNINRFISLDGFIYLKNSLFIAVFVAVIGTALSFVCAYFTSRSKNRYSKLIHLFSLFTLAVPGLVLGLSYVLFFKGTFLYGGILILIFVNIVHFFSSPYLLAYNSFSKINYNLEDIGRTLGVRKIYIVKDVIIPLSISTILEMFSFFFVNSMMTISAIAFLANYTTKPVSLMITAFESQGLIECAAIVSLLILICNIVLKTTIHLLKNRRENNAY